MSFTPMRTDDETVSSANKTLLYGHHGWGKTSQAKHLLREYGPGFIISGEAGLRSIMDEGIDYLPFTSWDGTVDPARNVYSFKSIQEWLDREGIARNNYKWIMLDSLTELSDRVLEYLEAEHAGSKNGFQIWQDYAKDMISAVKWVRDQNLHVIVTALAREEKNDNGETEYWPAIKGSAVQKQIPGIFDNVMCGVRVTEGTKEDPEVKRFIVTDEVRGWHGKVRDPYQRVPAIVETADVTKIFDVLVRGAKPRTGDDS